MSNNNHIFGYDKIESPIEEIFLNHLTKFLDDDVEVLIQFPLNSISGNFRADIALKKENKIVIIECNGEEHHTKEIDDWYDEWRDTLILVQDRAETIYRLKGIDINDNVYSLIYLIYNYDSDLFNQDYIKRLNQEKIDDSLYKKRIYYNYIKENGHKVQSTIEVKRKNKKSDFDRFWLKYVLYSLLYRDKNIYELIEIMKTKIYEFSELLRILNQKNPEIKITNENQLLTKANCAWLV